MSAITVVGYKKCCVQPSHETDLFFLLMTNDIGTPSVRVDSSSYEKRYKICGHRL